MLLQPDMLLLFVQSQRLDPADCWHGARNRRRATGTWRWPTWRPLGKAALHSAPWSIGSNPSSCKWDSFHACWAALFTQDTGGCVTVSPVQRSSTTPTLLAVCEVCTACKQSFHGCVCDRITCLCLLFCWLVYDVILSLIDVWCVIEYNTLSQATWNYVLPRVSYSLIFLCIANVKCASSLPRRSRFIPEKQTLLLSNIFHTREWSRFTWKNEGKTCLQYLQQCYW